MTTTLKYFLILLCCLKASLSYAVDRARVSANLSPVSKCNPVLPNEIVTVNIANSLLGSTPALQLINQIPTNTINVKYQFAFGAGPFGPLVSELISTPIPGGAIYTFSFAVPVILSNCGTYRLKVFFNQLSGDTNPVNDTLVWTVQNDCTIIPGDVTSDITVCSGSNFGALNLTGSSYGTVSNWQSSTNSGASWINVLPVNTTNSNNYTNLNITTQYRVIKNGGFCPPDTSDVGIVTMQAPIAPGFITGTATWCADNANGSMTWTGSASTVDHWQYETFSGGIWSTTTDLFSETFPTSSYVNLPITTRFRVQVNGNACPDLFSPWVTITVEPIVVPGTIAGEMSYCDTGSGSLTLSGNSGSVLNWESSTNPSGPFTPVSPSNTSTVLNYSGVTQNTYYRCLVNGIACADKYSDTAAILVFPNALPGTISGSDSLCISNASGVLTLLGTNTPIIQWETSTNFGATWNVVTNTTTTFNYASLLQTTWFRVYSGNGLCPKVYSDTAIIFVDKLTDAGLLIDDHPMCQNDLYNIYLDGVYGTVSHWETSLDFANWDSIPYFNDTLLVTGLTNTLGYRVIVNGLICPSDTSNNITIIVFLSPLVNAGLDVTINQFDTVQLNGFASSPAIWSEPLGLENINNLTTSAFPDVTTTYLLSSTDPTFGCMSQDTLRITVIPFVYPAIEIKNIITQGKDGFNDFWFLSGVEKFPNTEVSVYNIFGNLVYKSLDYKNDWDGSFKDNKLPNGTYYYVVLPGGSENVLKGTLTLIGDE